MKLLLLNFRLSVTWYFDRLVFRVARWRNTFGRATTSHSNLSVTEEGRLDEVEEADSEVERPRRPKNLARQAHQKAEHESEERNNWADRCLIVRYVPLYLDLMSDKYSDCRYSPHPKQNFLPFHMIFFRPSWPFLPMPHDPIPKFVHVDPGPVYFDNDASCSPLRNSMTWRKTFFSKTSKSLAEWNAFQSR